jgi:two-component system, OmpR family, sensor histidine kinase VicK
MNNNNDNTYRQSDDEKMSSIDNYKDIFTKVYYGSKDAHNAILQFIQRARIKIDSCASSIAPSVIIEVDAIKKKRIEAVKNKGIKLRYVTEITKDNIRYVKEMLSFSEIRHLDGLKGNFEVSDEKEYVAVATLYKGQSMPQLIFSNLAEIVEQQQFIFDSFWNRAIPSEQKIKEIEEGIVPPITTVFSDHKTALEKEFDMIKNATKEIQILYSTVNAFHLQANTSILQLLKDIAKQNNNLKIRILTPIDSSIKKFLSLHFLDKYYSNIQIQDIAPSFNIKIKTLVVDRKESLIMELKHMREEKVTASIGFSIYSNSEPTVLSYASIFEVLYNQSILFQQLKQEDNIKSEFINVAAHELRTPIMPILNGMEILEEKLGERKEEFKREMDIITRNALRLQTLAESILQVSRIESGSFSINIQNCIDIHFLISQVIEDIEKKYAYTDKVQRVSIIFLPHIKKESKEEEEEEENKNNQNSPPSHSPSFYIDCDSQKISQVIFNLLDNAMKFTAEGKIIVSTTINELPNHPIDNNLSSSNYSVVVADGNADCDKKSTNNKNKENFEGNDNGDIISGNGNGNGNSITVTVEDTGIGINPHIKEQLFEKFATKSKQGTGLGLYLSKKIIEAHGGAIWFEESNNNNNPIENSIINSSDKRRGTLFRFRLPVKNIRKDISEFKERNNKNKDSQQWRGKSNTK